MDSLSQRYGNPFLMLDEFIRLEQLHEFITEVGQIQIDEKTEQFKWEFFLHKVFDKSYEEFLRTTSDDYVEPMDDEQILDIVRASKGVLDAFY